MPQSIAAFKSTTNTHNRHRGLHLVTPTISPRYTPEGFPANFAAAAEKQLTSRQRGQSMGLGALAGAALAAPTLWICHAVAQWIQIASPLAR